MYVFSLCNVRILHVLVILYIDEYASKPCMYGIGDHLVNRYNLKLYDGNEGHIWQEM